MHTHPPLKVKIQVYCGDKIAMGPGKADLLEAIDAEGSISGAGRAMGMSYRRTWLLVDAMNRCWADPLVVAIPGGSSGGGAQVTPFGHQVLRHYRAIQRQTSEAAQSSDWTALQEVILNAPRAHKRD